MIEQKVQEIMEQRKKNNLARAKRNYALAKELGLNAYQAGAVAQWSEKRIRAYAEENKKLNG